MNASILAPTRWGLALWLGGLALPTTADDKLASLPNLQLFQRSLGAALDQACAGAAGDLAARCGQLLALDTPQRQAAINQLTPFQLLPQSGMPIKLRIAQVDTRARLAALRQTSTLDSGGAGDGEFRDGPLGLFVQTKFQASTKDKGRAGFDADTYGFTLGADYRFNDHLVMGLATGYTHTATRMAQNSGRMDSDSPHVTLFGNYYLPGEVYLDWAGTYTRFNNDLSRNVAYPGFSGTASSQPDADLYGLAVSLGKDFSVRQWLLSPYARFEYAHLHLDRYREQGGQGLNYEVGAQTDESFISISGFQASYNLSLPWGVVSPSLRVEWEHQFLNDNRQIRLRLADAPAGTGYFFLPTGQPDRDYVNLGGAVTATLPGGGAAFLRCEARLGQTALNSQTVELGVRLPF